MAIETVSITPGSGKDIAVDTISAVEFQVVKIAMGADGANDGLVDSGQQTMANSLPVAIASDQAAVSVVGLEDVLAVTLSTDTSAYASGEVLADTQEIASAVSANGKHLTITTIRVKDNSDQGMGLDLVFLDANQSLGTENAAPSISDANGAAILAIVPIGQSDWIDLGGFRVATLMNMSLGPLEAGAATTSIWIGAISRGTGTYAADALEIKISIVRD